MRIIARLARRSVPATLATLLVALATLLLSRADAVAQRPPVDPRAFSLKPADLPRGFSIDESQSAFEQLRLGTDTSETDVVGVNFRTVMERSRTLENLQSGPVRVSQIIARSDDPGRATFSLDAQREYNAREYAYEIVEDSDCTGEIMCLVRREGPFVEYRIVAVKHDDTLVSTTAIGLPSAVHLDGAIALTKLSLARYDEQVSSILAAQPPPHQADARSLAPEVRAVATPTPTPAPLPPPPPTATPGKPPTVQPTAETAKVKLPSQFDERLARAWAELMSSTATTKSGEKVNAFLRRVVEETDVEVSFGNLGPNVGGELRASGRRDGDTLKVTDSEITINTSVMNESPRVLAAMLAHEITHADQPIVRAGGRRTDCVEDEVQAYGIQARVWASYWGDSPRPGHSRWERTMNYVAEVWRDGGEHGLRHVVRGETGTTTHSCFE